MNAPRSGCPINLTLEALGDRWSLIVIRDLMFGNRRHFRELLARSEERGLRHTPASKDRRTLNPGATEDGGTSTSGCTAGEAP